MRVALVRYRKARTQVAATRGAFVRLDISLEPQFKDVCGACGLEEVLTCKALTLISAQALNLRSAFKALTP